MSTFDESKHPRGQAGNDGQFATKKNSAPQGELTGDDTPAPRPRVGASLHRGDFGGYTLSKVQTMRGQESDAFSADLMLNRKRVGDIMQDGRGGETRVYFDGHPQREAFEKMVKENWDFETTYGAEPNQVSYPNTQDTVADALFGEHDLRKKLNRARTSKKLPVLLPEDVAQVDVDDAVLTYRMIGNGVGQEAAVAADLTRRGTLEGSLYWDGESWVPFTA